MSSRPRWCPTLVCRVTPLQDSTSHTLPKSPHRYVYIHQVKIHIPFHSTLLSDSHSNHAYLILIPLTSHQCLILIFLDSIPYQDSVVPLIWFLFYFSLLSTVSNSESQRKLPVYVYFAYYFCNRHLRQPMRLLTWLSIVSKIFTSHLIGRCPK